MNEKKLTVTIKEVYGKRLIYPHCEKSKIFAGIARSTSLTMETINKIKSLGYEIEVKQHTL